MKTATYPTKIEYVESIMAVARERMNQALRNGWAGGQTSIPQEAHAATVANEHYDYATFRGLPLKTAAELI